MNLEVFFFCIYLHVSLCVCLCVCVFVSLPVSTGQCSGSHNRMNKFFLRHCWVSHTPLWLISYPVIMFGGRRKKKKQTLILFNCVKLSKKKNKNGLAEHRRDALQPWAPEVPAETPAWKQTCSSTLFSPADSPRFFLTLESDGNSAGCDFFFFPPTTGCILMRIILLIKSSGSLIVIWHCSRPCGGSVSVVHLKSASDYFLSIHHFVVWPQGINKQLSWIQVMANQSAFTAQSH